MTLASARRNRNEQIGDILTAIEHIWKMYPSHTLGDVLTTHACTGAAADEFIDGEMSDDELEQRLRFSLQSIMKGGRDRT